MITYHTPSERLYFSLSNDVNHYILIYDPFKMCLKNSFFHFYFFYYFFFLFSIFIQVNNSNSSVCSPIVLPV